MKKLFLDDYRNPIDCVNYMHTRIGKENPIYLEKDWIIVKNYKDFCNYILEYGVPDLVSFDHDLADEHYLVDFTKETLEEYHRWSDREMTGQDCAEWLINYCSLYEQLFPKYYVHSMNPVGTQNIISLIENFKKLK